MLEGEKVVGLVEGAVLCWRARRSSRVWSEVAGEGSFIASHRHLSNSADVPT